MSRLRAVKREIDDSEDIFFSPQADGLYLANGASRIRLTHGLLTLAGRWSTNGQQVERSGVVLRASEQTLYLEYSETTSTRTLHNRLLAAGVRLSGVKLKESDPLFKGTPLGGLSYLQLIAHYVNGTRASCHYILHTSQGWNEEKTFFTQGPSLIPDQEPRESHDGDVYDLGDIELEPTRVQSGSTEGFRAQMRTVQAHPGYNFAVSCAFAGALAPFVPLPRGIEGGFHIFGDSSEGKTTALRLLNAIQGISDLKTWDSTSNSLELIAERYNHSTLALDEMGQARDATVVLDAAYKLAQGQGKNRMSAAGQFIEPVKFNLLFVSSGEMSFEDYHRQTTGRAPMSGQRLRFLDIPWDDEMNPPLAENESSANEAYDSLTHCIENQRGQINEFIAELTAPHVQASLKERFEKTLNRFSASSRKAARVRARFALLRLGAEIAKEVGILPSSWDIDIGTVKVFERFTANEENFDEGVQLAREFYERVNDMYNAKGRVFNGYLDAKASTMELYGRIDAWAPYNSRRLTRFLGQKGVLIKDTERKTYRHRAGGGKPARYIIDWAKLEEVTE